MSSVFGSGIIEMFPVNSPIQDETNPLHELIVHGIGKVLDDLEDEIYLAQDERFLRFATGKRLDLYGDWFGILRNGRDDDNYRSVLIAYTASSITISGIKTAISNVLAISEEDIIVLDGAGLCCKVGAISASRYSGNPCRIGSRLGTAPGVVTIKIPQDSGIEILRQVIDNLVLASVTVILEEYVQ